MAPETVRFSLKAPGLRSRPSCLLQYRWVDAHRLLKTAVVDLISLPVAIEVPEVQHGTTHGLLGTSSNDFATLVALC
jgi:hypothetical protein